ATEARLAFIPIQRLHVFDGWRPAPWVPDVVGKRNPTTLRMEWRVGESREIPGRLFSPGYSYRVLGVLPPRTPRGAGLPLRGPADAVIQRLIELLQSLPTIPIWLALTAALPRDWSPQQVFFAITVILSLVGWTTLGREVRGRFLALREEDFVLAAELAGASQG